jgi:hypothetical protein
MLTTFEVLDHLMTRMEDSLNKETTVDTGVVEKEQLIEIKRLAENISIKCSEAMRKL